MLSPYSVLMSVYEKEDERYLSESLGSIAAQIAPPAEIVLVEDGHLTDDLYGAIDDFDSAHEGLLNIVKLDRNQGLGRALSCGLTHCKYEIVVRMDSDDYSFPNRVQNQLTAIKAEHLDIVGSQVVEFIDDLDNIVAESSLPVSENEIIKYSRKRNPFRHPSVVFRKSKVLEAGNYNPDFLFFEDWELFNRMLTIGCRAKNINEPLVAMRVSRDYYKRRGGLRYCKYIWKFKVAQLRSGYFTPADFVITTIPHVIVSILPNSLRSLVYDRLLRKTAQN